jgi:hypothetical protein
VASQTLVITFELGPVGLGPFELKFRPGLIIEQVKHHALPRIFGRDFQNVTSANPSHHHRVVEEEAAGVSRIDAGRLKAGL